MATTTNYNFTLPTVGASSDRWGSTLNATIVAIDTTIKTVADSVPSDLVTRADFNGAIAGLSGAYAALSHGHSIAQVSGLRGELDGKLSANGISTVGGHIQLRSLVGDRIALTGALGGDSSYAIGIESSTLYFRSAAVYRWYIGTNADLGVNAVMDLTRTRLRFMRQEVYHEGNLSSSRIRDITVSTASPSGGSDGDIWLQY